jgi:hypothetical protein
MTSKILRPITDRKTKNDVFHTPLNLTLEMIEMCELKDGDKVLDPSAGNNKVFFNNFPDFVNKEYCEITEGKDFFEYNKKVDCVIGNPPYSMWDKWIEHTMEITDKFCYIFGFLNATNIRLKKIIDNGFGITKICITKVEWWFGSSMIILFEKNKPSIITVSKNIKCDICGKRCDRGIKGNSPNVCVPKISKRNAIK